MAIERPHFINGVAGSLQGPLVQLPEGAYHNNGVVIGAVGVSGDTSDNDEAAAFAGIDAAGFGHP